MSAKKPKDEKIGNIAPFGLRMMPDLRERIEGAARDNGRSMNAEIVQRLEASFEPRRDASLDEISDSASLTPDEVVMIMKSLGRASKRLGVRITLEAYPDEEKGVDN